MTVVLDFEMGRLMADQIEAIFAMSVGIMQIDRRLVFPCFAGGKVVAEFASIFRAFVALI